MLTQTGRVAQAPIRTKPYLRVSARCYINVQYIEPEIPLHIQVSNIG
jgi:hypothetical protein